MYLSLDILKRHLNLEPDVLEYDELLLGLIQVAEQAVQKDVNQSFSVFIEKDGCVPAPLIQAVLLMAAHLFQNREITGTKVTPLPFSYEYLIELYKNYKN